VVSISNHQQIFGGLCNENLNYTSQIEVFAFAKQGSYFRYKFSNFDMLISNTKKVFLKAPTRVGTVKEKYPNLSFHHNLLLSDRERPMARCCLLLL
jgi:hypothetical protein